MNKVLLFKGEGPSFDFWESKDSELKITRSKGQIWWLAIKDGEAITKHVHLDILLQDLKEQHNINAILDKSQIWVKDEAKDKMVLQWTHVL